MRTGAILFALGCGTSTAAHAAPKDTAKTIEEERTRKHAEEAVAQDIYSMNGACHTTLADTDVIDWTTWKATVDDKGNRVATQCRYIAVGSEELCRSDGAAQKTFAKNVERIVCRGDGSGDLKFELKGATLIVHTFHGAQDTDGKTKKWLYANLRP